MSRRSKRAQGGQAIAETALVLPVLILLLLGLFDFGRAVYAYNTVSNAARDGARVAIVNQQTDPNGVPLAAIEAANQATALDLDPADPNEVRVRYLTPDLAAACPASWPSWQGCVAEVRVQYEWRAITPVVGTILGPIVLSSTTRMTIERSNR